MPEPMPDEHYLGILFRALHICAQYTPKFGRGRGGGVTLEQFQAMYGADPFYNWIGLASPLMYAAHKAAGGMTSIYRQIGIGCESIFRQMLAYHLGLTDDQAGWSYEIRRGNTTQTLTLDGRIDLRHLQDEVIRERVENWLEAAKARAAVAPEIAAQLTGAVFEVRQGYKSKDAKRQNADIANSVNAYQRFYLPVVALFSTQIDEDIAERYEAQKWLMLIGTTEGASTQSTYAFCRDVVGYDLAGFFERNSGEIKKEVETILTRILTA